MLNDEISATGQVNGFTKSSFYLLGDTKLVEDGQSVIIVSYNLCLFRSNALYITLGIIEDIPVVNYNLIEVLIEQITQHTGGLCLLTQYLSRRYRSSEVVLDRFPGFNQHGQVFM